MSMGLSIRPSACACVGTWVCKIHELNHYVKYTDELNHYVKYTDELNPLNRITYQSYLLRSLRDSTQKESSLWSPASSCNESQRNVLNLRLIKGRSCMKKKWDRGFQYVEMDKLKNKSFHNNMVTTAMLISLLVWFLRVLLLYLLYLRYVHCITSILSYLRKDTYNKNLKLFKKGYV